MKRLKSMGLLDVQKQVSLIIKPKERQKIEKTKQDLNSNVDPVNLNITNIENWKNGTIITKLLLFFQITI